MEKTLGEKLGTKPTPYQTQLGSLLSQDDDEESPLGAV